MPVVRALLEKGEGDVEMSEKIKIKFPIIVEGRYDKSAIASMFDATVVTTGGFAVFNSKEKQALIKKLAEKGGIILLTDSDGGGKQIRSFLSGIVEKEKLHHLYIPEIKGKEKRKKNSSKAGLLGVEGVGRDVLEKVLLPFVDTGACEENTESKSEKKLTKLDLFQDGLSGAPDASQKRKLLAEALGLPKDISANSLVEIINLAFGYTQYREAFEKFFPEENKK